MYELYNYVVSETVWEGRSYYIIKLRWLHDSAKITSPYAARNVDFVATQYCVYRRFVKRRSSIKMILFCMQDHKWYSTYK
jgi:DNA-directed RNA polymerase subunit RPC12/RpoP